MGRWVTRPPGNSPGTEEAEAREADHDAGVDHARDIEGGAPTATPNGVDRRVRTLSVLNRAMRHWRETGEEEDRSEGGDTPIGTDYSGESALVPNHITEEQRQDTTLALEEYPLEYHTLNDTRSVCQEDFKDGQSVTRLECKHGAHTMCWTGALQAGEARAHGGVPLCPLCRKEPGQALHTHQFNRDRYALNHATAQEQPVPHTDHSDEPSLLVSEGAAVFLSRTSLANGRIGLIVDPGSVWDIAGSEWAKSVAWQAGAHGLKPSYEVRRTPLNISGVGNGSQQCAYDCELPVALRTVQGIKRTGVMYTPTVVKSQLPAC